MPLSQPNARREIHHRAIDMKAYLREDGLYEVESHLVDTKAFAFERLGSSDLLPAGRALHDLWIRIAVDSDYSVRAIEASSDTTPYGLCKEAESTLQVLVGERIAKGWSALVKERLRGAASCTHLMEMLIPLATTALQGIRGLKPKQDRRAMTSKGPAQIDSCYAYGREREVVKWLWPTHYQGPEKQRS